MPEDRQFARELYGALDAFVASGGDNANFLARVALAKCETQRRLAFNPFAVDLDDTITLRKTCLAGRCVGANRGKLCGRFVGVLRLHADAEQAGSKIFATLQLLD